jgi:hypothetical protein
MEAVSGVSHYSMIDYIVYVAIQSRNIFCLILGRTPLKPCNSNLSLLDSSQGLSEIPITHGYSITDLHGDLFPRIYRTGVGVN